MAEALTLRVITPETIVLDTPASIVRLPGIDGSMGVLPRHAPMVAALGVGELSWRQAGSDRSVFVAGGLAEVRDDTVRVVSQASEPAEAIDVERAQRAAERARERLRTREHSTGEPFDLLRAEAALHRALARLRLAGAG